MKIILLLKLIIALCIMLPTTLYSQYEFFETCYDTTCTTNWTTIPLVEVEVDGFEGCSPWIGGYQRVCNGVLEIYIAGFKFIDVPDSCQTKFDNLTDTEKARFQIDVFRAYSEKLFNDEYDDLPSELKYQLECGPGGGTKSFAMILASCSRTCYYLCPSDFGNYYDIKAEVVGCGQYCCRLEREICFNTITGELEIIEVMIQDPNKPIGADCSLEPIPDCFGSYYSTPCVTMCEN